MKHDVLFSIAGGAVLALTFAQSADAQQTRISTVSPFVKARYSPMEDVDMDKDADLKRCAMQTLVKLAPLGSEFTYISEERGTSFFAVQNDRGMHNESNIFIKAGKSGPATLHTGIYNILKKDYDARSTEEDLNVFVIGNKGILMQPVIVEDISVYTPQQSNKNYIHPGVSAAVKKSMQMYDEMRLCMPELLG